MAYAPQTGNLASIADVLLSAGDPPDPSPPLGVGVFSRYRPSSGSALAEPQGSGLHPKL
jgi:hypothetical protein